MSKVVVALIGAVLGTVPIWFGFTFHIGTWWVGPPAAYPLAAVSGAILALVIRYFAARQGKAPLTLALPFEQIVIALTEDRLSVLIIAETGESHERDLQARLDHRPREKRHGGPYWHNRAGLRGCRGEAERPVLRHEPGRSLASAPVRLRHPLRSCPRRRAPRLSCVRFARWVPAFAGTSGGEEAVQPERIPL